MSQSNSSAPQSKPKEKVSCQKCGSDKVLFDAYAEWNPETQEYEITTTFDYNICDDCGAEESANWETI